MVACTAMVLPITWAGPAILKTSFTFSEFFEEFLGPVIASAVIADVGAIQPWINWWRCAVCRAVDPAGGLGDINPLEQPAEALTLAQSLVLSSWASKRVVARELLRLSAPPVAGGLSDAAVVGAITGLQASLTNHETERVAYRVTKDNKTITDKFGPDMMTQVHRMFEVDNDDEMPAVHRALARNKDTYQEGVIIESALLQARMASGLPVSDGNSVKVTKQLQGHFRTHNIHSNGATFGEGFTPFAVTCSGHPNAQDARRRLEDSNMVERGGTVSLVDARAMAVTDLVAPSCRNSRNSDS